MNGLVSWRDEKTFRELRFSIRHLKKFVQTLPEDSDERLTCQGLLNELLELHHVARVERMDCPNTHQNLQFTL